MLATRDYVNEFVFSFYSPESSGWLGVYVFLRWEWLLATLTIFGDQVGFATTVLDNLLRSQNMVVHKMVLLIICNSGFCCGIIL